MNDKVQYSGETVLTSDSIEMQFTYKCYEQLLGILRDNGYAFSTYHDYEEKTKSVILRHDIDTDPDKAIHMADIEFGTGVNSTWFVLVSADLYNIFSHDGRRVIQMLQEQGHEIGLHFDETVYAEAIGDPDKMIRCILEEKEALEQVTGTKVSVVSMHRPSK